jgi:hypothetical protein
VSGHDEREDYDDEPLKSQLAPMHIVRRPATIMMICGILQLIAMQVFLVMCRQQFSYFKWGDKTFGAFWNDITQDHSAMFLAGAWLLATAGSIVIIAGSRSLLQFRRYGLVFAAAILTVLSLPWFYLCVVQVPTGVIVIRLLRRPDVRARFAAVARGTMNASPPEAPDARRTDPA